MSNTGLSFSGADVKAYASIPAIYSRNGKNIPAPVELSALQTISVSIFREKSPVRALGWRNIRGTTRGGRTIAGSLIFALVDEHPLKALIDTYAYDYAYDVGYWDGHSFPDQIPPFNINLLYQNELGDRGGLSLIGVDLTNDGMVSSIQDMLTENTYQYIARDMFIWDNLESNKADGTPRTEQEIAAGITAETDLIEESRSPGATSVELPASTLEASGMRISGITTLARLGTLQRMAHLFSEMEKVR